MAKNNGKAVQSDALVLFGVTGDLAHKMIFPALYAMVKRGALTVPVIGVALQKWRLEELFARVRDSLQHAGGIDDQKAFDQLLSHLSYVSGDYNDQETFAALKKALGDARRPAHISPSRPRFSKQSYRGWALQAWLQRRGSSSKNHSDGTWRPLRS
jgi:glucose-6-phosphate 1-dehydrogenase